MKVIGHNYLLLVPICYQESKIILGEHKSQRKMTFHWKDNRGWDDLFFLQNNCFILLCVGKNSRQILLKAKSFVPPMQFDCKHFSHDLSQKKKKDCSFLNSFLSFVLLFWCFIFVLPFVAEEAVNGTNIGLFIYLLILWLW